MRSIARAGAIRGVPLAVAVATLPLVTLTTPVAFVTLTAPSSTMIWVAGVFSVMRTSNSVPSRPAFTCGVAMVSERGSRLMMCSAPRSMSRIAPKPLGGSLSVIVVC